MTEPLLAETGRCVACGLCLPHCPTYRKTQSEADSPRGRILLTQAVMQGVLPMNQKYIDHIDLCLTCRSCESACPNHVPYGEIVDEARARITAIRPPALTQRIAGHLVSYRLWWHLGGMALRLCRLLGLHKRFPAIPATSQPRQFKPSYTVDNPAGEVALFLGCATSALDSETLAASIFVLNRLRYTVHVPQSQTCCGGLHRQAGDKAGAEALDHRNRRAFANLPVVAIASGCGARLIDTLPGQVQDISTFLAKADWNGIEVRPLDASIAVHDPCSLRNGLKAEKHPHALLKRIPGAAIRPLPGNAQCCGGAGSYMLSQPDMAGRLLQDKIEAFQSVKTAYLATSNIGCALQLAKGLGAQTRIAHPVWILARQMGFQGTP